ncbi:MAG TPA: ATP-binding protein [Gaiellaceae bacterium]
MTSSRSLGQRMFAASTALAILVCAGFVVLFVATSSLQRATDRERRSKDVTVATLSLEKLVLDLDSAVRVYLGTRKQRLLAPWREARAKLPARERALKRLVRDDPEETRRVYRISSVIKAYQDDYAEPMIQLAQTIPALVRDPLVAAEGATRAEGLRRRFDGLLALESKRAAANAVAARREKRRALVVGVTGFGASMVLILLFGLYLTRAVARPIREVAGGATRLADGDLSARMSESGPGEVGTLTRAFNAMASSLEQSRNELEEQNERLRKSDQLKSELVSMVAHEFRTPLTSILGFTNVMRRRELDDYDRHQYLVIVEEQARRLAALIDDFLDVQRIEEGQLELKQEFLDVRELLRQEARAFAVQTNRHTLELDLPNEVLPVYADPSRLLQVVGNLISNAIKYSPEGGEVELHGARNGDTIYVGVRDHGVGIATELQDRIFTKFFRGDANARGISGTGLGLALARDIVEAHGGRMGFSSVLNRGSTFWVELPTAETADGALARKEH